MTRTTSGRACLEQIRMKKISAAALATWFGCGLSPVAPGTAGSAAALAIAWWLRTSYGWQGWMFAAAAAAMLAPAIWAAEVTAVSSGKKDPQIVVIDEVLGQWVTLAGAAAFDTVSWIAAFLLFRAFDIVKPPPVRQLERLPGGLGIVADDIGAGIYGAVVLYAIEWTRT
jgi:phosphatidylglycerophosphatase A